MRTLATDLHRPGSAARLRTTGVAAAAHLSRRAGVVFRGALVLLLAACAGAPTPTPTPTATPTPLPTATPTPLSQPPDGSYTTSVSKDEIAKGGTSADFVCENAGTYTMTVAADHWSTVQAAVPDCTVSNPNDSGTWKFAGSQVVFTEDTSLGCSTVYTYTWSYQGRQMGFAAGQDDCAPRVTVLTSHPWVKQ
jgi:hypothetical protein